MLAASVGGYWFAHGSTAFLTLVLPFGKVDRVIAASLLSFAVWCAVAVYVFATRSAWRAWLVPAVAFALCMAAYGAGQGPIFWASAMVLGAIAWVLLLLYVGQRRR